MSDNPERSLIDVRVRTIDEHGATALRLLQKHLSLLHSLRANCSRRVARRESIRHCLKRDRHRAVAVSLVDGMREMVVASVLLNPQG
jgi:hypothetical protein